MPVFRWGQSWDPFRDLEREVDRLLQGMNLSLQATRSARRFPLVNLIEYDDRFLVTAEAPGLDAGELEITTAHGVLTLKGVRRVADESGNDVFRRQERFQGTWQRSVQLPDRIDEDGMSAEYTAGILKVTLPKAEATEARRIPVLEGPE